MSSIQKGPSGGYMVRWRPVPGGPERSKTFKMRRDAERFLTSIAASLMQGTYIGPNAGLVTFKDYSKGWLEAGGLAPTTARAVTFTLAAVLREAVDDGRLVKNPAERIRVGAKTERRVDPMHIATVAAKVPAIAAAIPARWRAAVLLMASTGLRLNECLGLTVDRVNFLRRTIRVDRQLVDGGGFGSPKTRASVRTIPVPEAVVELLAEQLAEWPAGVGELIFTTDAGGPVSRSTWSDSYRAACAVAELEGRTRTHDLRHVAASSLIASGLSVAAVSSVLGHAGPAETLEVYTHLWPSDEERTSAAIEEAAASWLRVAWRAQAVRGPARRTIWVVTDAAREIGYFYPAPYWSLREHDWAKSLLLFFDQVAILLPDYMYGRHYQADPSLVGPLEERGLLLILEPRAWIDEEARIELTNTMSFLLDTGAFDGLNMDVYFQELSHSRAGYRVDVDVADELVERLGAAGLVKPSNDGVSLPMHPVVRSTFLVLLGQLARGVGERNGEILHPTTANRRAVDDLVRFLLVDQVPAVAPMIETDLIHVGVDASSLSLDDVVALRDEHREEHTTYMRSLRGFVDELSRVADESERRQLVLERREAIDDEARRIHKQLSKQTRQLASVGIGIAGAAWSATTGDPVGLLAAAASLGLGLGSAGDSAGAYTYLFKLN